MQGQAASIDVHHPVDTEQNRPTSSAAIGKRGATATALALLGLLGLAFGSRAQESLAGFPDRPVVASRVLVTGGGRLSWSAQGDRLAVDKPDDARDGLQDIWLVDLESGSERCLTCSVPDFKGAHALDPSWHPSGNYLVFQAQQNARKLKLDAVQLVGSDRGVHSDLWLARADGKDYWQLTRSAAMGSAVLDPHFSHEGDRLLWSDRYASREGGDRGLWQLRSAELQLHRGVPSLKRVAAIRPDPLEGLVLAEGFMPDDRRILMSAQHRPGSALDIGVWDPDAKSYQPLTGSTAGDDQYPRVSPRGDLLVWVATATGRVPGPSDGATELPAREIWIMALDGSGRRPLTQFNGSSSVEGLGRCWVGDLDFSPDGDQLAVQVIYGVAELRSSVVVLQLDPWFRRRLVDPP